MGEGGTLFSRSSLHWPAGNPSSNGPQRFRRLTTKARRTPRNTKECKEKEIATNQQAEPTFPGICRPSLPWCVFVPFVPWWLAFPAALAGPSPSGCPSQPLRPAPCNAIACRLLDISDLGFPNARQSVDWRVLSQRFSTDSFIEPFGSGRFPLLFQRAPLRRHRGTHVEANSTLRLGGVVHGGDDRGRLGAGSRRSWRRARRRPCRRSSRRRTS